MNTKLALLIGILGITFCSTFSIASSQETRVHIKCYLQLEDKSTAIKLFVNNALNDSTFADSLLSKKVFMADGLTQQQIIDVYECVALNGRFSSDKAIYLENNSAF